MKQTKQFGMKPTNRSEEVLRSQIGLISDTKEEQNRQKVSNIQAMMMNQQKTISMLVARQRMLQIQGQCRIVHYQPLHFNKPRAIFFGILFALTFIGIIVLKYSLRLRKKLFYDPSNLQQCTHLLIVGNEKDEQIVEIMEKKPFPIIFLYKKMKYQIQSAGERPYPIAFPIQEVFQQYITNEHHRKKGLQEEDIEKILQKYGKNQHLVDIPTYFQYLFDVLLTPFFFLQYLFVLVFFLQGYAPFSACLLFFTILTASINYILLYRSYLKIKQIAEKVQEVKVIRNGKIIKIDSSLLVPGDIYIPEDNSEVPADCIMLTGDIYVNQANLTGQSYPIGKFPINSKQNIKDNHVWLYEGSRVLETRQNCTFAIVIQTGFTTTRGRIIRRILFREIEEPDFIISNLFFVIEIVVVSLIVFFATLFILLREDIDPVFKFFKFIDFLASSAPPPLPIFFNLGYSVALIRLRAKNISGSQPQKTVDGAQVKTFFFDKTGTLTKSDVQIRKIIKYEPVAEGGNPKFEEMSDKIHDKKNRLLWQLFATCHGVKVINQQILGDQIDRQMFVYSGAKISNSPDINIKFTVKPPDNVDTYFAQEHINVLKINQFQSKFQSMSVLIYNEKEKKYFVLTKGAPEKLLSNSINVNSRQQKVQYNSLIKNMSIEGFRTIAMGYKQVKKDDLNKIMSISREQFQRNIHILGMVAFDNVLKNDTVITMQRLKRANIDTKIITGDNIYIAIQTGRRAGVISQNHNVILLQGKNQPNFTKKKNLSHKNLLKDITQEQSQLEENKNQTNPIHNREFHAKILKFPTKQENFSVNLMIDSPEKFKNQGKIYPENSQQIMRKPTQQVQRESKKDFEEYEITIKQKQNYMKNEENVVYAIDNDFMEFYKPYLNQSIKIFARIPPENKSLIIRTYKQQHLHERKINQSKFQNFLKINNLKFGMCGDGANDLLALRQADVSVGIQETDASYGSSFIVSNISDVYEIIRQGKCTLSNMRQLFLFYESMAIIGLYVSIAMLDDVTYYSLGALMFLNFGSVIIIPSVITFSGTLTDPDAYAQESKYTPDSNILSFNNHLLFWGNVAICSGAVLGSYFFYKNTQQFEPNPIPRASVKLGGFNSQNHSATILFFLILICSVINAFIWYKGRPWKIPFYRNILFVLIIIGNIGVAFIMPFMLRYENIRSAFEFVEISRKNMGISIGILCGGLLVNIIYHICVNSRKLDHKILKSTFQTK